MEDKELYEIIERLEEKLPSADMEPRYCISMEFDYKGHKREIRFYKAKASETASYFWICNPFNSVHVAKF